MEKITQGAIELTWDAGSRLAHLRYERETAATGPDARVLVDALATWVGTEPRPFALLADNERNTSVDAEWRSIWGTFFKARRDHSYIAVYHMNAVIRVVAKMFRVATGMKLNAFADEQSARSWLRENGIGA